MTDLHDKQAANTALDEEFQAAVDEIRAMGRSVLEELVPRRVRATFKAMPNMDPSRYRPSSEALIRRCLGQGLGRINPIVDLNNTLSIRFRFPLGVYDLDLLPLVCIYRLGTEGEEYSTISLATKSAQGKLVLADDSGVVGSPFSDSSRAAIRAETSALAVVAYFPFETNEEEAATIMLEIEAAFNRHFAATPTRSFLLRRSQ
ncbi:MAG TPA: phenylalanine--tRNA ligase beta subunit-related protein [Thermoanaerobaculia bacterium]|nr:phenylalanine--tRNA ligase beta subunit-related protein [Thermoanaerobaculia bacterium]